MSIDPNHWLCQHVTIDREISATCTAVLFRSHGVLMECKWWHNGECREGWFEMWRLNLGGISRAKPLDHM